MNSKSCTAHNNLMNLLCALGIKSANMQVGTMSYTDIYDAVRYSMFRPGQSSYMFTAMKDHEFLVRIAYKGKK